MEAPKGWRKVAEGEAAAEGRLDAATEEFWREIRGAPPPSPIPPANIDFVIMAEAREAVSRRRAVRAAWRTWAMVAGAAAAVFAAVFLVLSGLDDYAVPGQQGVNGVSMVSVPPLPLPSPAGDLYGGNNWVGADIGEELSLLELELDLQELNLRVFAFN